jgi:hypothetical protein
MRTVYGIGEQGTSIWKVAPEISLCWNEAHNFQMSIPFIFVSGNLGSTTGAGDILLNYSYRLQSEKPLKFSFTAGTLIPSGKTDIRYKERSFPMPYQTGLGTLDAIVGVSASYKNWFSAIGLQKVIINNNNNSYLHSDIYFFESNENSYFESNQLDRGDDLLFRVERKFILKKFQFTPGALLLYRINNDKIDTRFGQQIEINNSVGLTLNLTSAFFIPIKSKINLVVEAGAPIVVREFRPDGLTRSMVLSLKLNYLIK